MVKLGKPTGFPDRRVQSGKWPLVLLTVVLVMGVVVPPAAAITVPYDPFFANQATIADFGAATRPFGVAAGDYDGDGKADLVVGRTTGNVAFVKGNGDGTFAPPVVFAWKQAFFNAWAFAPADVNADGKLDVVWGANATSTGCSVSPIPIVGCPSTVMVNDGEVRVFYGNGDGTFQQNTYFVSGVLHNAGSLIADIGTDAGSVTTGDIDADGDVDIVGGAIDGANSVVKILRNNGVSFGIETLISQAANCTTPCSPIYFPAISTQNSPWGLSLSDVDGDGDRDLFVGDRALYVYRYNNDGTGSFSLQGDNSAVSGRPNVYLGHDVFRAAVGFTASLGSADLNGDGKADLALGLHSGTQTPASLTPKDGSVLLDVSAGSGHSGFGSLADVGTMARGVTVIDVNGDGNRDVIASEYDGKVKLLRQLPPLDTDEDGISDYVDNAPSHPNAPRLDVNTDASTNHLDQLDNDFDTVLGNPEDSSTWQRRGDVVDPDDDNDGVDDASDNCPFAANDGQGDADGDAAGDACDPLDDRDPDGDGVPTGPMPGDSLYEESLAAKIKWSQGSTHFVIRIDALGRFFQNEFTQLMADAATLSPADWQAKCWENYQADDLVDGVAYEPCGTGEGTPDQTVTLPGGKEVPTTLVVIPKQLWTDSPVVAWINDRNDNARLEIGQHGTYHASNTTRGDWMDLADRNFFSCEICGLTEAEALELMKVGYDTLKGNYSNKWVAESGATGGSPKIDWSASANSLLSFAPPFNTSDTTARNALAQLGYKAFSASIFEEGGAPGFSEFFTPEGSHHEQFDQFGMFHASADLELEPPDTTGDTYETSAYNDYLQANTDDGGLTTWLIEEVEWSGRPCNNDDRLGTCNGASNRENNTVYQPRWDAWMQLLDFVKNYPGGVAMTMGQVALAQAFDNAPTVANPDQADTDHDGIGDVIEGATLAATDAILTRNQPGSLAATLSNGAGDPLVSQEVTFSFDADGDSVEEQYTDSTDAGGTAEVSVTPTRPVGTTAYTAQWDGLRGITATDTGDVTVADITQLALDASNPSSGQVTDSVTVGATLTDGDGAPLDGRSVNFQIGGASASGTTDSAGHASATLTLQGPAGATTLQASFAGAGLHGPSSDSATFEVTKEDTTLTMPDATATRNSRAVASATLKEADGAPLADKTIEFFVQQRVKGSLVYTSIGTSVTDSAGVATKVIASNYVSTSKRPIRAVFSEDVSFLGSTANAFTYRT